MDKILQENGSGILSQSFNSASEAFIAELGKCSIKEIVRSNEQIKLVQELSLAGELLALYRKDIQDRL